MRSLLFVLKAILHLGLRRSRRILNSRKSLAAPRYRSLEAHRCQANSKRAKCSSVNTIKKSITKKWNNNSVWSELKPSDNKKALPRKWRCRITIKINKRIKMLTINKSNWRIISRKRLRLKSWRDRGRLNWSLLARRIRRRKLLRSGSSKKRSWRRRSSSRTASRGGREALLRLNGRRDWLTRRGSLRRKSVGLIERGRCRSKNHNMLMIRLKCTDKRRQLTSS